MSKTLYLECNSGISGDMFVAALLDLGADETALRNVLDSLPLNGFKVQISRVNKAGLDACDFNVILEHENHDHDMEYLYGSGENTHDHGHAHSHGEEGHAHEHGLEHDAGEHEHSHEACAAHSHGPELHEHVHNHAGDDHGHEHVHSHAGGHHHHHEHRGLPEIIEIISKGNMTDHARVRAIRIFDILADAESKAHGLPKDQVHFHEVGAVDSIVDIVAAAVCLDNLGITDVIIPKLNEGTGTVRCQHGILPVPVPAVANIVAAHGLTLHIMERQGEFVTPTGAAIAAAIRTSERLPERFVMKKIGLGAGKRNYEQPSLVRAILIETSAQAGTDTIVKLESNIDDCTGETLGYVMDQLFAAGARDVHYTPVFMKKNRPAYQLNVICDDANVSLMEQIIFVETTTIGIRRVRMERTILDRRQETIATPYGDVRVKICELPDGKEDRAAAQQLIALAAEGGVRGQVGTQTVAADIDRGICSGALRRIYPEYESVAALSRKHNIPYARMYQLVLDACRDL